MATIAASRSAAKQDAPSSHPYSCNTCQVAFRNSDLQKGHMKGDWHRYNLKRRVASLPPITSELFAEKVLQSRASTAAAADRASFERVCDVCQKTYYSENSYQNHIGSQKHKAREARGVPAPHVDDASSVMSSTFSLGEPQRKAKAADADSQLVDSDAEEEFSQVVEGLKAATIDDGDEDGVSPVKRPGNPRLSAAGQRRSERPLAQENSTTDQQTAAAASPSMSDAPTSTPTPTPSRTAEPPHSLERCLFCNYASPTVALSIAHMERFHGMFIPEKQYLVDLEGLLTQLEHRIRDYHECIFCGKIRSDVFAVQTHMRDKAHCKIPYMTVEEQVEIGDFYDFRGTYSDDGSEAAESDDDDEQPRKNGGGGARLGARRATRTTALNGDSEETANGGEGGDDGWETDSSASSLDSADLTAVPADNHIYQYGRLDKNPHHSQTDPRAHHLPDGWHSHAHKHNNAVFYDEYELHLPSGRSVGHRSLNHYFRQNLRHYPSMAEREKQLQLAIEAGADLDSDDDDADEEGGGVGAGEAMDVDENGSSSALARTNNNQPGARAMTTRRPPRNTLGLAGVSDKTKSELRRSERRAVMAKAIAEDKSKIQFSAKSIGQSFRFLGR
ncbi:c2h2 finger domain containing protein [Niveomyces insectorum RCEF 264]|uniref:C2h2 finger domain containing protein n=1 Tax=Niveomyces insectorum RCEF 264 TaxID=1081102 RepID=A0A167TZ79_9HYPO|nr:c2h2 finger domain containing protein [Niveomyces insectorum RCEF 264]